MEINDLGDVIAVRELFLVENRRPVFVKLGKPRQFPDSSDYYVPFQITGAGSEKIRYAGGVDAIQALQLVMKMIGIYLDKINRNEGGLKWEGGGANDFGFG
jgi:Domain of unknown function (DUF6968)